MRFRKRIHPNVHFDMTPLIDVIFLLLLFFMLSSVFRIAPAIGLQLPEAKNARVTELTPLRIQAANASEIWINDIRTNATGLSAALVLALQGKEPAKLDAVVEADAKLPYQTLIAILDALRAQQITGIRLMTQGSPK